MRAVCDKLRRRRQSARRVVLRSRVTVGNAYGRRRKGGDRAYMLTLVIGLALFFAIHLIPTQPPLRAGLVDRYGEAAYKIAFAVVSLVGLALIVVLRWRPQGILRGKVL